jgi:hypothetical protein
MDFWKNIVLNKTAKQKVLDLLYEREQKAGLKDAGPIFMFRSILTDQKKIENLITATQFMKLQKYIENNITPPTITGVRFKKSVLDIEGINTDNMFRSEFNIYLFSKEGEIIRKNVRKNVRKNIHTHFKKTLSHPYNIIKIMVDICLNSYWLLRQYKWNNFFRLRKDKDKIEFLHTPYVDTKNGWDSILIYVGQNINEKILESKDYNSDKYINIIIQNVVDINKVLSVDKYISVSVVSDLHDVVKKFIRDNMPSVESISWKNLYLTEVSNDEIKKICEDICYKALVKYRNIELHKFVFENLYSALESTMTKSKSEIETHILYTLFIICFYMFLLEKSFDIKCDTLMDHTDKIFKFYKK